MSDAMPNDVSPSAGEIAEAYPSLAALRAAHSGLIQRRRLSGDTPAFLAEVQAFIARGQATGALLDADGDRLAAQSLLDFWANVLMRAGQEPPEATLADFDPSLAPELPDEPCPYRGLEAFRAADRPYFFGRQRLLEQLLAHLQEHRLLAVVGPSGSGKSSLVLAGLLPALEAGALPDSALWRCLPPMVPGSEPLRSLARALLPSGADEAAWVTGQSQRLAADPAHLANLVGAREPPVVLTVDQFEEAFALCRDPQICQAFAANLVGLATATGARHTVILTMRSDFETQVARLPELQEHFEKAILRVTPLSAAELREAILGPAALVGLRFEEGIVDTLVADILGEPAGLPLLQFTLLKLWKSRDRNRITWEAYRRLGGGRVALARSADAFYAGLIPEEQVTARRILLRLAQPGAGLEVTSGRLRREALYKAGEARERVDRVLAKLVAARLVRLTGGDTADPQVEIAHEALVRNWPQLVAWLEEERVKLRQRRVLMEAAEQWQRLGRDPGMLWGRGAALDEALCYDDLSELEAAFVQASQAAVEQEARRREEARQREVEQARLLAQEQRLRAEAESRRADEERRRAELEHRRAEEQARTARQLRHRAIAVALISAIAVIAALLAFFLREQALESQRQAIAAQGTALAEMAARATSDRVAAERATGEASALLVARDAVDARATLVVEQLARPSLVPLPSPTLLPVPAIPTPTRTPAPVPTIILTPIWTPSPSAAVRTPGTPTPGSPTATSTHTPTAAPSPTQPPTPDRNATGTAQALAGQLQSIQATQTALARQLDCIPFRADGLKIVNEGRAGWLLTDGFSRMAMLATEADARQALALVRGYTAQCFIGRGNTRPNRKDYIVAYWTGLSGVRVAFPAPEDCVVYDPKNLRIVDRGSRGWELIAEALHVAWLDNETDARRALALAQGHTRRCFIGRDNTRPDPASFVVEYWR